MDPYESNTGGLLNLLSDYGSNNVGSADLLALLAGWPGPTDGPAGTSVGGPTGGNPDYDPSTQQDIVTQQQQQQQQQIQNPVGNIPAPSTSGGTPTAQTPPPQQQQQQSPISTNPMQLVGIAAVLVVVFLAMKKK